MVAVDGEGNPALLRYRTGQGAMVLATYPFEHFAAETPFCNPEPTWRLYQALAAEAGVERPVTVADPRVTAAEMLHEDGRHFVWLVSHSPEPLTVAPQTQGSLADLDGAPVTEVDLEPYGVVVLQRRT